MLVKIGFGSNDFVEDIILKHKFSKKLLKEISKNHQQENKKKGLVRRKYKNIKGKVLILIIFWGDGWRRY